MRNKLLEMYTALFAKPSFEKWNRFLHHAALRGLGVLNFQNDEVSGETAFLIQTLSKKENPVVLDVGANVGRYSSQVLAYAPSAALHAFEPHPKTFLKLNEQIGNRATTVNKGVGSAKDTLELFDYESNDGSSHASIHKGVIEDIHRKKAVSHQIEVIALEEYLGTNNITTVDLLKIDTEGNELAVLKGLGSYLTQGKINCIHFEFNEMNILSKASFKDFFDLLEGYQLSRLLPGGKRLFINDYVGVDCEIYAYQNIIAEKK